MAKERKRNGGVSVLDRDVASPELSGGTTAANVERDRIAERAYELYVQRGGEDGRDLDDWLEAEREVERRRDTARTASSGEPTD
jgi:hypothetical protein